MKNWIVGIALIFSANSVFAQTIDLGVKGGVNIAKISEIGNYEHKVGLHGGVFGGMKFPNRMGFQVDILYSQIGGKGKNRKLDLNYVQLPVVFKYFLNKGLNVQLGPQVGILVQNNLSEELGRDVTPTKTDFSGVIGMGYDFRFGGRLDIRYNYGLTNILQEGNVKNRVLSISLGYSFYRPSRSCYRRY